MSQTHRWYFAFGAAAKSPLLVEFCREHNFIYCLNPTKEQLQANKGKNTIIEAPIGTLKEWQPLYSHLETLFVGKEFSSEEQQLMLEYTQVGMCKRVKEITYSALRKNLNPRLIFIYGPNSVQGSQIAQHLSRTLHFRLTELPANPNELIASLPRTRNCIINGFYPSKADLLVLEEYFHFKVIHLIYSRNDIENPTYFNNEYEFLPTLKVKPYYVPVPGKEDHHTMQRAIGVGITPEILYFDISSVATRSYIFDFCKSTETAFINIYDIQNIRKRKDLTLVTRPNEKVKMLTEILHSDFTMPRVALIDFPQRTSEFEDFQSQNRAIKSFINLVPPSEHREDLTFCSPIYYLEKNLLLSPNLSFPLIQQLNRKSAYWIVTGPACSGKSTLAKYLSNAHGLKLIEFDPYVAGLKEKLLTPEDGEELPARKVIAHFANLIQNDAVNTYIIDGLTYDNKDLSNWLQEVGSARIINLRVDEPQLIRRTRRKAESDVNAQVTEEDNQKAKDNVAKNSEWSERASTLHPMTEVYQMTFNMPFLMAEKLADSIVRSRVYLVQQHDSVVFQNVAIKNRMHFINLSTTTLKQVPELLKKAGHPRSVMLCYYASGEEHSVSEDMSYIEKYVGDIRYVAVCTKEDKVSQDAELVLEKPVVSQAPKPAAGEQGGDAPPAEDPPAGEEAQKKQLDIYQFKWTKPTSHKNLSQWLFKLKANIVEKPCAINEVYSKFHDSFETISTVAGSCIYQLVEM